MSLKNGDRLGAYEVTGTLGAGGMGEVFQARDTRLGRDVALKVLPAQFIDDPDRLARFEREAKVLASLNHPNIAQVFGLEHGAGAVRAIAMELVTGPTLADRIADGALAVTEALAIARQIADALEAAHEQAVVHRDLKPANIKVREDGTVKVLDFGLAKAMDLAGDPSPEMMNSPTLTARATQLGVILGTAAYMAPEQAKGKPVDRRADIWAFGVVLFEMLSGRRAFEGTDISETMASVLAREPDWSALPAETPAPIQKLLRQCLQKDRKERTPDVAVARFAIRDALTAPGPDRSTHVAAAAAPPIWRQPALWITTTAAALVVGAATWWLAQPAPPAPAPVGRFAFPFPPGGGLGNATNRVLAISPLGTHIAFESNRQLWVRRLDDMEPTLLAKGDTNVRAPFFSPDGQQIGFVSGEQVKRIALSGGSPAVVGGPVPDRPFGVSWGEDGFIYIGIQGKIARLPETGGVPQVVIDVKDGERADGPQLLPGGEWLLFTLSAASAPWDQSQIVAESLATHERRVLVNGGRAARVTPTGHLLYVFGGVLFGWAFDAKAMAVRGGPVSLVEGVRTAVNDETGAAYYDISLRGDLAYMSGGGAPRRLVWVDREGRDTPLPFDPALFNTLRLAPDGRRIAVEVQSERVGDIWLYSVDRPGGQRLTFDGDSREPVWSPTGEWVYYASLRDKAGARTSNENIWRRRADFSGEAELVLDRPERLLPWSISANPARLFLNIVTPGRFSVGMLPLDGATEPTQLIKAGQGGQPSVSPDGKFVTYQSFEGRRSEVHVMEIASGRTRMIWTGDSPSRQSPTPTWAGTEIFFWSGPEFQSVKVISADRLEFAPPKTLYSRLGHAFDYEVTADGKWFIHIVPATQSGAAQGPPPQVEIRVVLNWFEELKAKVPVK